jgi:hypothetical protein
MGAVGFMDETGVAKGLGAERGVTSEEANSVLVAADASGALAALFLGGFGLRISNNSCFCDAAGRFREAICSLCGL